MRELRAQALNYTEIMLISSKQGAAQYFISLFLLFCIVFYSSPWRPPPPSPSF